MKYLLKITQIKEPGDTFDKWFQMTRILSSVRGMM